MKWSGANAGSDAECAARAFVAMRGGCGFVGSAGLLSAPFLWMGCAEIE